MHVGDTNADPDWNPFKDKDPNQTSKTTKKILNAERCRFLKIFLSPFNCTGFFKLGFL